MNLVDMIKRTNVKIPFAGDDFAQLLFGGGGDLRIDFVSKQETSTRGIKSRSR